MMLFDQLTKMRKNICRSVSCRLRLRESDTGTHKEPSEVFTTFSHFFVGLAGFLYVAENRVGFTC